MEAHESQIQQYFRPGGSRFVGDCMPFAHDGAFHLLYLLDEGHHQGLGGLGGHQWAHASTRDLVCWTHHPLALAIDRAEEASICTGSVYVHDGLCHAFYAVRYRDWTEHLGHAVSLDGVRFTKQEPNPFFSAPPGYDPRHCRDPFVFRGEDGAFHMLVTACRTHGPPEGQGGCLLRLTSSDLCAWQVEPEPFFLPDQESSARPTPECPDAFRWGDWYYLLYGSGLRTRYRRSRSPFGPWEKPRVDLVDSPKLAVMKTAPFGESRRIGAGWIGSREGDRDGGAMRWGGNLVLRELVQNADGTLATRFVPESGPAARGEVQPRFRAPTPGAAVEERAVRLGAGSAPRRAVWDGAPSNYRLRARVLPGRGDGEFGLVLRCDAEGEGGARLSFDPTARRARLEDETIEGVDLLQGPFDLEVVCSGDILDVCLGGRRCLLNRLPQARGSALAVFAGGPEVALEALEVVELAPLQD